MHLDDEGHSVCKARDQHYRTSISSTRRHLLTSCWVVSMCLALPLQVQLVEKIGTKRSMKED